MQCPTGVHSAQERYHSLRTSVSQYLSALGNLIGSKIPGRFQVTLMGRFNATPMQVSPSRGELQIFAGRTFEAEKPLKYFEAIVPYAAAEMFSFARENSSGRVEQGSGKQIGLIAHRVAARAPAEKFSMVRDVSERLHVQARECYLYGVGYLLAQRLGVPGRIGCSAAEAIERVASAHSGLLENPHGDQVLLEKDYLSQLTELAREIATTRVLQEVALRNRASQVVEEDLLRVAEDLERKFELLRKSEGVVSQADARAILSVLEDSVRLGLSEQLESFEKMRSTLKTRYGIVMPCEESLLRGEPTAYQQLRSASDRFAKLLKGEAGEPKLMGRPLNATSVAENLRRAAWNLLEAAQGSFQPG
jgi:hypothetical protein